MKQTKSFTLIEVLIGIVVLGILSSFIIVSISSFVDDANDTKRKKDLDSIASSLLAYRALTGSYPIESNCNIGEESCLNELTESGYATNFPIDPDGTRYTYTSDGTTYTIKASLSNNQTLTYNPDTGYSEYQGLVGYTKRKSITVASSASLTDFQVKIDVTYDSDMQTDFDDIRFTASDGSTELSYWLESKTESSSAVFWVKVPSLSIGDNYFYLYYGNASASSGSNGDNTFEFFDDFEGSSVDTSKWSILGSPTVANSTVSIIGTDNYARIISSTAFSTNNIFESYARIDYNSSSNDLTIGFMDAGYNRANFRIKSPDNPRLQTRQNNGTTYYTGNFSCSGLWKRFKLIRNGFSSVAAYVDSLSTSSTSGIPSCDLNIWFFAYESSEKIYVDWVFVRKYTATEPSVSFWGEEETI